MGAGASSYTYAWSGTGTSGQTTAPITIANLGADVDALCTVTGTNSGPAPTPNPDSTPSTVPVTGVTLSKTTLDLTTGESGRLSANVAPSDATDKKVTWTSSDPDVVSVDQTGKITAVGPGTATITVTTKDGSKKATCTITVTEAPAPPDPTEQQYFTFSVNDCEVIAEENADGTWLVKIRLPFAGDADPTTLAAVKAYLTSLGLTDLYYSWIDAQGNESPLTAMKATAPYLEIAGTAANRDAFKNGTITSIRYTLTGDDTEYVQTFGSGGLKIADMPGFPSESSSGGGGGSSSGCNAGFGAMAVAVMAMGVVGSKKRK